MKDCLVSVRIRLNTSKKFFSALGRRDRRASRSVEIDPSAVAAEASTGSIADLDTPRGVAFSPEPAQDHGGRDANY